MSGGVDLSWREGAARAYSLGLAHGKAGTGHFAPDLSGGFDACYYQGFGHGSGVCRCPAKLAGKRDGRVCVVCGVRRGPDSDPPA